MNGRDPAFEEWVQRARDVPIRAELERRGVKGLAVAGETNMPCPRCGGDNRFGVNTRKNVWLCGHQGGEGGDVLALVQHLDDLAKDSRGFLIACETLTGEPPPDRHKVETDEEKAAREARFADQRRPREQREAQAEAEENKYREDERRRARKIWLKSVPIAGTMGEEYFALRGLPVPPSAHLKFLADAKLWKEPEERGDPPILVYTGPAIIAGVTRPDGKFGGVELTFIDLSKPKGKAEIADPQTGEILPAKKMRGSCQKGGAVTIYAPPEGNEIVRVVMGEGKETVLTAYCALLKRGSDWLDDTLFLAALSLNNLAGRAGGNVKHPTLIFTDAAGHVRHRRVGSDELVPVEDDLPLVPLPKTAAHLVLIGDGDSDPFATKLAMSRAAKRYARGYPQISVAHVWARAGDDLNSEWMARGGAA